jgi:UDP-2-acetamido-3-amino-2,3-dideoxy-glucuronate N-acetyltransferase
MLVPYCDPTAKLGSMREALKAAALNVSHRGIRAKLKHVMQKTSHKTRARDRRRFQKIAPDVKLGANVQIHDFVNLYGCDIGDNTKVGPFVEIQKGVSIGRNCKISSHSFICEGVRIADEVFVGHHVVFINDLYPRATTEQGRLQKDSDWRLILTSVGRAASIGSGAVILCGIEIGERSMIGAGSVVVKDVPPYTIVAGNPARVLRRLPRTGRK